MAKKITGYVKLQIAAGKANPSPPVGPALGQAGLNIMEFCKSFNEKTSSFVPGSPVPVVISVYADKSFDFTTKKPPVSYLIMQAAKIKKGSGEVGKVSDIAKITKSQVMEIVKEKIGDLNTDDENSAFNMIQGTARSMGVTVVEG